MCEMSEKKMKKIALSGVMGAGKSSVIAVLKEAGIPAGVVSTKRTDTLTAVLEARGVRQYLVSLTGGDKVDRPKPDPQGLLAALAELGLKPENVLYCGDTLIDAETAHRAGAHFCAVLNGTTTRQDFEASGLPLDHVAEDLGDLKAWLGL